MNRSQTQSSHLPVSSDTIRRMVEHLILNGSFTSDLGLFHGKMGIVIFFAHYARWTGNALYEDFADELLAEIYEDIHTDTPINLEGGLCGIGWGIEYLVQNGFMEGDTDEILEDIDRRIMERDPRRMTDLSFRTGLGGILFYATARLTASRESDGQPFDSLYLNDLKEAAQRATFTEQDEIPSCLFENLLSALRGEPLPAPSLPTLLFTNLPQADTYLTLPIGLEKGIAGKVLCDLQRQVSFDVSMNKNDDSNQIFLVLESSRAQNYGIGTYISQLIEVLSCTGKKIIILQLSSTRTQSTLYEKLGAIHSIHIGTPIDRWNEKADWKNLSYRYYRAVLTILYPVINKHAIFNINYIFMADFAVILKKYFPNTRVITTIHYTDWSMNLLGDMREFRRIMNSEQDHEVKNRIIEDKRLLDASDFIISIARHSHNTIRKVYGISEDKLIHIPHGIMDEYKVLSQYDKQRLRSSFGFKEDEFLIVFAGRIDKIKGVDILADSFTDLVSEYPQIRLIFIGEGDFSSLHTKTAPYWSRIVTTGFLDKRQIYDIFSISNMGVIPSIHEEFGLVALEMMMMGLPIVASKTSGLAEIVIHGETGLSVQIDISNKRKYAQSVKSLQDGIKSLISDRDKLGYIAKNGREHFLRCYKQYYFKERILRLYRHL